MERYYRNRQNWKELMIFIKSFKRRILKEKINISLIMFKRQKQFIHQGILIWRSWKPIRRKDKMQLNHYLRIIKKRIRSIINYWISRINSSKLKEITLFMALRKWIKEGASQQLRLEWLVVRMWMRIREEWWVLGKDLKFWVLAKIGLREWILARIRSIWEQESSRRVSWNKGILVTTLISSLNRIGLRQV